MGYVAEIQITDLEVRFELITSEWRREKQTTR